MGLNFGMRNCIASCPPSPAPDPDPRRWEIRDVWKGENGYVLRVRYLDCTNFEGMKIMVYRGKVVLPRSDGFLDPHFSESEESPIARFPPTLEGWRMATALAKSL